MVGGPFDAPSTLDPELMKRVEAGAKQLLERELAAVDTSGIEVESLVEPRNPPMRSSTQPATPVCSSSERAADGSKGLLLGSVSQQASHHAPCPVVIVPPPDKD